MKNTYYHVTGEEYKGGALCSFDELDQCGMTPEWKWGSNVNDTDVVCLFDTIEEAEDFVADGFGSAILVVEIPNQDLEAGYLIDEVGAHYKIVKVDEGYTAIAGQIPAGYIRRME